MTKEELKTRKIEFLEKFKDLTSEYVVIIDVNPDNTFYLVTDGHISESWQNETIIDELTVDCITSALNSI